MNLKLNAKRVVKCLLLMVLCNLVWNICVRNVQADEIDDILPYLIQAESSGNPNAVSSAGCIGLCQINPNGALAEWNNWVDGEWKEAMKDGEDFNKELIEDGLGEYATNPFVWIPSAQRYSLGDLYNPTINIEIALWYLRRLRDHYLKGLICNPKYNITDYGYDSEEEWKLAVVLGSYNWGIGNVTSVNYDINRFPKSVKRYIRKILRAYKNSQNLEKEEK